MNNPITFPITPEAFNAYQEQLIGQKLSDCEQELNTAWAEVFNLFYEDGLRQDCDTLAKALDDLAEFIARHKDNARAHKFAEACRAWMIEAWRQGKEAAQ